MKRSLFLFTALLLLTCTAVQAAAPSAAWGHDDGRLTQKKVTTQALRIYLGDLLEQWSKQTGVSLSADTKDGAADEEIAVWVQDMPLGDAMNAVRSLVSYQGYEWRWERTGNTAAYGYVLHQGDAGKRFRASVAARLNKEFSDGMALLLKGADMTDAERAELARQNPDLAPQLQNQNTLDSFRTIKNRLSEDQRKTLFEQGGKVSVALAQAGEAASQLVMRRTTEFKDLNPGQDAPRITRVTFGTEPYDISRVLFIGLRDEEERRDFGIFGGAPLARRQRAYLRNLWLLSGDTATSQREKAALTTPPQGDDPASTSASPLVQRELRFVPQTYRLQQLAATLKTPVMARVLRRYLSSQPPAELRQPANMTLEAFLNDALDRGVDHKWSSGTLLFASHLRQLNPQDAQSEPWSIVGKARAYQAASAAGVLSLEQAAQIASEISLETLKRLAARGTDRNLTALGPGQEILTTLLRGELLAAIQTKQGVPYAQVAAATNKILRPLNPKLEGVMAARIRTVSKPASDVDGEGYNIEYRMEILNGDGNVIHTLPVAFQRGTQPVTK